MATTAQASRSPQQQTMSLRAAPANIGSQTQTEPSLILRRPVLRLRGASRTKNDRKIQWAEDVVDNEGLGRKSSKGMSHHERFVGFEDTDRSLQYAVSTMPQSPSMSRRTKAPVTAAATTIVVLMMVARDQLVG